VPQAIAPADVAEGLPANLPDAFPLPSERDAERTYHRPGKNTLFFASDAAPADLRATFERTLPEAGYELREIQAKPDGSVTIHFRREGKLGYVSILPTAPARYDGRLGLTGTFVDITFELTPPPLPVLPRS